MRLTYSKDIYLAEPYSYISCDDVNCSLIVFLGFFGFKGFLSFLFCSSRKFLTHPWWNIRAGGGLFCLVIMKFVGLSTKWKKFQEKQMISKKASM